MPDATDDDIPTLPTLEQMARAFALPELVEDPADEDDEPVMDPLAWANCPDDVP